MEKVKSSRNFYLNITRLISLAQMRILTVIFGDTSSIEMTPMTPKPLIAST